MENESNKAHQNLPWDIDWSLFSYSASTNQPQTSLNFNEDGHVMFQGNNAHHLFTGHVHPDPSLTCLKLGKRQYYEDGHLGERHVAGWGKRGKLISNGSLSSSSAAAVMAVPRCQVEGCHVALVNVKDYHRRHKVCEMHSKAPKVVVLGIEQRFCQQCSRFHVVSEFDDSKRSCRRRLAGHNERRRKNSNDPMTRTPSQENKVMGGRFPSISSSSTSMGRRALSLLSSKASPWVSPADLSSRSSAALRELIAENRAAALAMQLFSDRGWHQHTFDDATGSHALLSHMPHEHGFTESPTRMPDACRMVHDWDRHFHESSTQVTLDLMQAPNSSFGILSGRNNKSKDDEEECCDIWKSLEGTHVI